MRRVCPPRVCMDADSSTVLQQKATRLLLLKDAADRDSLPSGRRFDHFTAILDQLRRATSSERGRQVGRSVGSVLRRRFRHQLLSLFLLFFSSLLYL